MRFVTVLILGIAAAAQKPNPNSCPLTAGQLEYIQAIAFKWKQEALLSNLPWPEKINICQQWDSLAGAAALGQVRCIKKKDILKVIAQTEPGRINRCNDQNRRAKLDEDVPKFTYFLCADIPETLTPLTCYLGVPVLMHEGGRQLQDACFKLSPNANDPGEKSDWCYAWGASGDNAAAEFKFINLLIQAATNDPSLSPGERTQILKQMKKDRVRVMVDQQTYAKRKSEV